MRSAEVGSWDESVRGLGQTAEVPAVLFAVFQKGDQANGGVESISQVFTRLQRHRPIIVTQKTTPTSEEWATRGIPVHHVPQAFDSTAGGFWVRSPAALAGHIFGLVRANWRVWRLVRATAARVAHCNDMLSLLHAGVGARLAGARVVLNIRGTGEAAPSSKAAKWRLARRITSAQVVLSNDMASFWRPVLEAGTGAGYAETFHTIYSAVDLDEFSPVEDTRQRELRRKLGIEDDVIPIVYVGTFNRGKAQLEAIRHLVPRLKIRDRLRLYFLGDFDPGEDSYAADCLAAAAELGLLERVRFVGFTPRIADWYRVAELTVVASRSEGMARAMIESLACATAVVSFDVTSAREILCARECGVVVNSGDFEVMASAIGALLDDSFARERMGARGREIALELFEPAGVLGQYEDLYAELASS